MYNWCSMAGEGCLHVVLVLTPPMGKAAGDSNAGRLQLVLVLGLLGCSWKQF